MNRRSFLSGLGALVAAAAVVAPTLYKRSGLKPFTAVDADNQTGSQLIITPAHRAFHVGDVITFAGVYATDRHGNDTEELRQFVVTAHVAEGTKILSLYPPVIPRGFDERSTVTETPNRWGAIEVVNEAPRGDWLDRIAVGGMIIDARWNAVSDE